MKTWIYAAPAVKGLRDRDILLLYNNVTLKYTSDVIALLKQ